MLLSIIHKQVQKSAVAFFVTIVILASVQAQVQPNSSTQPSVSPVSTPSAYTSGRLANLVRSWDATRPYSSYSSVSSAGYTEAKQNTQYIDGLGRLLQSVDKQMSPGAKDMVQPYLYDAYGRQVYHYLPYTSGSATDGYFKLSAFSEQASFMSGTYSGESVYYGKSDIESSPLNRSLKEMPAGNSWAGSNVGTSSAYESNGSSEVRLWTIALSSGPKPVSTAYYTSGVLFRLVTTDENGKRVVTYKDKHNKVVLKKVEIKQGSAASIGSHTDWLCTYYIYDDRNNLRFVLQPQGVEDVGITAGSIDLSSYSAIVNGQCFYYEYDGRNRMILKKVPDAEAVEMVYDGRDRLIMTRDGNMRNTTGQWLVTTYDALNRPSATYLWTNSSTASYHQGQAASSSTYPSLSGTYILLTETYYDNYSWVGSTGMPSSFNSSETSSGFLTPSDNTAPYPRSISANATATGMATGTKVRMLETGAYLYTASFYDEFGRLIQLHSLNQTGGIDITTNQYSFDGKLLVSKFNHNTGSGFYPGSVVLWTRNTYDHAGRLLTIKKQVNSGTEVTIATNTYNETGQLYTKALHTSPLETLTYEYSIRGWLKAINKAYVYSGGSNYFGMNISYDYGFTQNQVNGNIGGISWRDGYNYTQYNYGYSYDPANRLMKADFTGGSTDYSSQMGDGSTPTTAYDANGNIKKLIHKAGSNIDDLEYGYFSNSNRLYYVRDANYTPSSTLGDFKEPAQNYNQDYTYDYNGNMISDANKSISAIDYNFLNLPRQVTMTSHGTVSYSYDALGVKQKKTVTEGSTVTNFYYINGLEYSDAGELRQIPHEEGRIRRKPDGSYIYDYYLKDHLGSVRVTLSEEQPATVYSMVTSEPENEEQETKYFYNVKETRAQKPSSHPTRKAKDLYASKLKGGEKKTGPAILLKVTKGDKLSFSIESWYERKNKGGKDKTIALSEIAKLATGNILEGGKASALSAFSTESLLPALSSFLKDQDKTANTGKPKAFLNWVLLDEKLHPYKDDTTLIGKPEYSGYSQVGEESKLTKHVKKDWKIDRSGYVYIFSNNLDEEDVFFENFTVITQSGPILEVNHTYPFGLTIDGISGQASGRLENKYRFNGGNELQNKEFSDGTGLEMYDANFRTYNAQIGRFHQIDPLADIADDQSPFSFVNNNPISFSDPLGLMIDSTKAPGFPNSTTGANVLPEVVVSATTKKTESSTPSTNQAGLPALPLPNLPPLTVVPLIPAPVTQIPPVDLPPVKVNPSPLIEVSTGMILKFFGTIGALFYPTPTGAGADRQPHQFAPTPFPGHGNNRDNSNPHIVYQFTFTPKDGKTPVLKYGISDVYKNGLSRPENQLKAFQARYGATVTMRVLTRTLNRVSALFIESGLVSKHRVQWGEMPREQVRPGGF